MALVTVQRSPSPSNSPESASSDVVDGQVQLQQQQQQEGESLRSPLRQRRSRSSLRKFRKVVTSVRFVHKLRFSESYFTVKGAALILPQSECMRKVTRGTHGGDIQEHLQSMFYLLRPQDTLKMAVKLESIHAGRNRYLVVVSCNGRQDTEESILLGIDCNNIATVGMVMPIWADTKIKLDGDGGFSVTSNDKHHIYKPVSVQAMWSALQYLHKVVDVANKYYYFPGGLTHTWVCYYEARLTSDRMAINEWNLMEDIESFRSDAILEDEAVETIIRIKLREVMMMVNLDEVTSKFIREKMEAEMGRDLHDYRNFIDVEMLVILGQMDSASLIFDYLYLGSEWNASNLEELQKNGVGYILNVTREIDNFFPGVFKYLNVRLYDREDSQLIKYWDSTNKFIQEARDAGSKVFVHCKMGVSRSASTVIAHAMKDYGWTVEQGLKYVKEKRSCIRPNKGFMQQLELYQGILDASKQRHNTLWRSKSETNLVKSELSTIQEMTPKQPLEPFRLYLCDDILFSSTRPKSWSPDEAEIMMCNKNAGLDPSEIMPMSCNLERSPKDMGDNDPVLVEFDKFEMEMSSRSADSMDEVFPDIPSPSTTDIPVFDPAEEEVNNVVLLSYRQYDDSISIPVAEAGEYLGNDSDEEMESGSTDSTEISEEENGANFAYYDVSRWLAMPTFDIPPDDDSLEIHQPRLALDSVPSITVEEASDGDNSDRSPSGGSHEGDPTSTSNNSVCTKIKADDFWIKEEEEDQENKGGIDDDDDDDDNGDNEEKIVPQEESQDSRQQEEKKEEKMEEETVATDEDVTEDILSEKIDDSPQATSSDAVPEHYEKEAIPWKSGSVKRQKKDFEEKIKNGSLPKSEKSRSASICSGSSLASSSSSSSSSSYASVDSGKENNSTPVENSKSDLHDLEVTLSTSPDSGGGNGSTEGTCDTTSSSSRPLSIYETEDICLQPGLVRRTTQEIEERHRVVSECESVDRKPVVRSSSLKTEREKSKVNREDERRKTCTPVLHPGGPISSPVGPCMERSRSADDIETSVVVSETDVFFSDVSSVEEEKKQSISTCDTKTKNSIESQRPLLHSAVTTATSPHTKLDRSPPKKSIVKEDILLEETAEEEMDTNPTSEEEIEEKVEVIRIRDEEVPVPTGLVKRHTFDFQQKYQSPDIKDTSGRSKEAEKALLTEEVKKEEIKKEEEKKEEEKEEEILLEKEATLGEELVPEDEQNVTSESGDDALNISVTIPPGTVKNKAQEIEQKYTKTDHVQKRPRLDLSTEDGVESPATVDPANPLQQQQQQQHLRKTDSQSDGNSVRPQSLKLSSVSSSSSYSSSGSRTSIERETVFREQRMSSLSSSTPPTEKVIEIFHQGQVQSSPGHKGQISQGHKGQSSGSDVSSASAKEVAMETSEKCSGAAEEELNEFIGDLKVKSLVDKFEIQDSPTDEGRSLELSLAAGSAMRQKTNPRSRPISECVSPKVVVEVPRPRAKSHGSEPDQVQGHRQSSPEVGSPGKTLPGKSGFQESPFTQQENLESLIASRQSRKMYGKTHPLSRLATKEPIASHTSNPLYNAS